MLFFLQGVFISNYRERRECNAFFFVAVRREYSFLIMREKIV